MPLSAGGILCAIRPDSHRQNWKLTPARILVSYVVAGVILGGLGLYAPIEGMGWSGQPAIPLTGFGYNLAKGVKEAVDQYGWIGTFTGGFTAAAGGVTAAMVFRLPPAL